MNRLNKDIVNILLDEIFASLAHSSKNTNDFFNALVLQNPEITSSSDEWNSFGQEVKDNIIRKVKYTLISLKMP